MSRTGGDTRTPSSSVIGRFDTAMPIMKKVLATKDSHSMSATDEGVISPSNQQVDHMTKINIAIETDEGDLQPPEIDEVEGEVFEEGKEETQSKSDLPIRRSSINDRIQKLKLGEDAANSIKIEAEQRKKVLENLLEEHESIVRKVVTAANEKSATH